MYRNLTDKDRGFRAFMTEKSVFPNIARISCVSIRGDQLELLLGLCSLHQGGRKCRLERKKLKVLLAARPLDRLAPGNWKRVPWRCGRAWSSTWPMGSSLTGPEKEDFLTFMKQSLKKHNTFHRPRRFLRRELSGGRAMRWGRLCIMVLRIHKTWRPFTTRSNAVRRDTDLLLHTITHIVSMYVEQSKEKMVLGKNPRNGEDLWNDMLLRVRCVRASGGFGSMWDQWDFRPPLWTWTRSNCVASCSILSRVFSARWEFHKIESIWAKCH